jgi:hypothetical protein
MRRSPGRSGRVFPTGGNLLEAAINAREDVRSGLGGDKSVYGISFGLGVGEVGVVAAACRLDWIAES